MATSDVKTPRSSKRKAAEALLEASLRDVQEKRDAALQSKLSEPCTRPEPQAQLVKRRKHGSSSALPFPATPQQSAEQKTSWRDICSSLTSCDLSVLVRPDATEPQQLSLTRTGATVLLVDQASQVPAAVELLRASMHDPILGIDLEWQADFTATQNNPVSLLQIASASCCLLVRSCCMKHKLPAELLQLFRWACVPPAPAQNPHPSRPCMGHSTATMIVRRRALCFTQIVDQVFVSLGCSEWLTTVWLCMIESEAFARSIRTIGD